MYPRIFLSLVSYDEIIFMLAENTYSSSEHPDVFIEKPRYGGEHK